ncbi:TPM domain-containing protein [Paracnuella aquatica]|uniref:TPM domain-containing protein n=1 Tax=Paracnuella aquatica TaxID=2268757 RepID=UPI000DEFAE66|nr:TPM domain-containing protein [Paracnuella aquatica]RPD44714.1 TPM domain-containing protein [Paracnuella aquatica]
MRLFPWQKQTEFFSHTEQEQILAALRAAEQRTSGELRIFVESRCRYVDAIDRAAELFFQLQMDATSQRNGVLLYLALADHQVAIYGDAGIHEKVGQQYWEAEVGKMLRHFREQHPVDGIIECLGDIGDALHQFFPYDQSTDKNELPDDIIFGR